MANKESPVVRDISLNSTAMDFDNNEDHLVYDIPKAEGYRDFDPVIYSWVDVFENEQTTSIDEHSSNFSIDSTGQNISIPSSISSYEYITPMHSPTIFIPYEETLSLSFINPPEAYYHVRYTSEITDSPFNGNRLVNTRVKTKKNLSGRYLKGMHGRYVTIALPKISLNCSNLYVRVTRLTVPYQSISFIHPYPLLYSSKKEKSHSQVISKDSSIYFKVNKDELCSYSKQFPNIILTRCKQCDLNKMNTLYSFDDNDISYRFYGDNAKHKIMLYNLKQSLLNFSLVIRCEQTLEFKDTGIFCRSDPLLEAEGVEWRQAST